MAIPIAAAYCSLIVTVLVLIGGPATPCTAANILAVFPSDYKSHFTLGSVLLAALAERGHHITLIAQYALPAHQRHTNITEIRLDGVAEHFREIGLVQPSESLRRPDQSVIDEIISLVYSTAALANYTLSHADVQRIIHAKPATEFDLLLLDAYYNDALLGLAAHCGGIPTVVLCATATNKWTNEMVGNPHNPAYNPSLFSAYTDRMSLTERLYNALASAFEKITYNYMYIPVQENIYHRYFSDSAAAKRQPLPPLIDLIHNVSLVLLNSHASLQYARPHTPNMLHIGGMHLASTANEAPAAAPKDAHLAKIIDEYVSGAPDGVIYVNLGAEHRSADLPAEQLAAFVRVFGQLAGRMRIVWKWENSTLNGQPSNVLIGPSMPQLAILSHPNVRLFITNGGTNSILEAIHTATPVVGIPRHADQFFNVAQAMRNGLGVQLPHGNLTAATIGDAIAAVLHGPQSAAFAANARRLQALLHDNAAAPLTVAVHGVEHVLRTGGAPHWRSAAVDLSLVEQSLVDVALLIAAGLAVIVAVPSVVICLVLRRSHAREVLAEDRANGVGESSKAIGNGADGRGKKKTSLANHNHDKKTSRRASLSQQQQQLNYSGKSKVQ